MIRYWAGSMAGRFIASVLLRKIGTAPTLAVAAAFALALVGSSLASVGSFAMWSIITVGLFNSVMFPSIFALGIANIGHLTGKPSGVLMGAAVGGAVVPVVQGALADRIGVHHSFVVHALCYMYVFYYALRESRLRQAGEECL